MGAGQGGEEYWVKVSDDCRSLQGWWNASFIVLRDRSRSEGRRKAKGGLMERGDIRSRCRVVFG